MLARFAFLFCLLFCAPLWANDEANPHAIAGDPPAEYLSCSVDADCTLEPGICGEAMAVNKSHAEAYRAASTEANSVIRCIRAGTPVTSFDAICKAARCERQPVKPLK